MYHTELNPLKKINRVGSEHVGSVKDSRQRRLHKALLRYHAPENWPIIREALTKMGRTDLIGNGKKHLVPAWDPSKPRAKSTGGSGSDLHHRIRLKPQPSKGPNKGKAGRGGRGKGGKPFAKR